jgi:hydrogenase/urease accessory protein HupE
MFKRISLTLLLFLLAYSSAFAHVIPYELSKLSKMDVSWIYLKLGYTHILPNGFDHILFVLGIFFLNPKLKPVIGQATAFTIAHSITLGLAMYGIIKPVSSVIEPVIALSIVFIAVENIFTNRLKWWRILIVFSFGLVHGCGFASALSEIGLPQKDYAVSLLCFNFGVELGQISVILLAFILVGKWFGGKTWYRKRILIPVSLMIGMVAVYWTIERIFFV